VKQSPHHTGGCGGAARAPGRDRRGRAPLPRLSLPGVRFALYRPAGAVDPVGARPASDVGVFTGRAPRCLFSGFTMADDEALTLLELDALLALLEITNAASNEACALHLRIQMKLVSETDRRLARCSPERSAGLDEEECAELIGIIEGALKTAPEQIQLAHADDFERFRTSLAKLKANSSAWTTH
jgi:hypothetical protein